MYVCRLWRQNLIDVRALYRKYEYYANMGSCGVLVITNNGCISHSVVFITQYGFTAYIQMGMVFQH